jgi:uncharacterized protein (TIGR03437 family)
MVTFSLNGVGLLSPSSPLGTATLASGTATINVSNLAVGVQTITALYSGDATWSSYGKGISVTVSPAPTSTAVSLTAASGRLILTGVVFTPATVAGAPTGTVQFVDSSSATVVARAAISGGRASVTIAADAIATVLGHPIAALYSGDGEFGASTSAPLPAMANAAATFLASLASDEITSLFGITGLKGDVLAAQPLATSLDGVTINITDSTGTSRLALLYGVFASAGQVNFMVPSSTAAGWANVTVTLPNGGTVATIVNITGAAPGIFTANMTGQGPFAGQQIYVHGDGSQTVANSVILNPGSIAAVPNPINLSNPGDQVYLVLYGTGIRHAGSLTASINGDSLPVLYFGPQGAYSGLDQINLGPLPASLSGSGTVNLAITADGQAANPISIVVQ